ncbi:MAG: InlB B-repeat-containing protein [Defluviitaleaceae bacterium]|nr:InlB B-repeat-containing protein [Defluviitaleaceae bacterium]
MKIPGIFALVLAVALVFPLSLTVVTAQESTVISINIVDPGEYNVIFNNNWPGVAGGGGIAFVSPTIPYGETMASSGFVMPGVVPPAGLTFGGWNTEADGGGTAFTANTPVTFHINVYAMWNTPANLGDGGDDGDGGGDDGGAGGTAAPGPPALGGAGALGAGTQADGDILLGDGSVALGDGVVPLGALAGDADAEFADLEDGLVPLGALQGDADAGYVEIDDTPVPLAVMPLTGLINNMPLLLLGMLVSTIAALLVAGYLRKLKKEGSEAASKR